MICKVWFRLGTCWDGYWFFFKVCVVNVDLHPCLGLSSEKVASASHSWPKLLNQNQPLGPHPPKGWFLAIAGRQEITSKSLTSQKGSRVLGFVFLVDLLVFYHGKYHHIKPIIWEVFFHLSKYPTSKSKCVVLNIIHPIGSRRIESVPFFVGLGLYEVAIHLPK